MRAMLLTSALSLSSCAGSMVPDDYIAPAPYDASRDGTPIADALVVMSDRLFPSSTDDVVYRELQASNRDDEALADRVNNKLAERGRMTGGGNPVQVPSHVLQWRVTATEDGYLLIVTIDKRTEASQLFLAPPRQMMAPAGPLMARKIVGRG